MEQHLKEFTLRILEYQDLKGLLMDYALTPLGKKTIASLRPIEDRDTIEKEWERLTEAVHFYQQGGDFPIFHVKDPDQIFKKLKVEDSILNGEEVHVLLTLLRSAVFLRKMISNFEKNHYYLLAKFIKEIPELKDLLSEIDGHVSEKGYIESSASKELFHIRKKIDHLSAKVKKYLEDILARPGAEKIIQDDYITLRTGRYVLPVRTDAPFPIQGIIHGASSTGHTIFVEPIATVKTNNEIIRFKEAESNEIERILKRYTYLFRRQLADLEKVSEMIGVVDFLHAKARFSIEYRCVCPEIDSGQLLRLEEARHPLLERSLNKSGRRIVPMTVELGLNENALVISGPNAGGKTVSLKTIGLLVLMAQSGMHVPARDMELPLFQQIIADIGDQQSITANLSTFSAHIENISKMARIISPRSLILIDEIGTGTDPSEGTALAVSIIEYFRKKGAMVVVTTHHGGLKIYAYKTEGVINAAMEFDEKSMKPTYRLSMGVAGSSSGIKMAQRLGLEKEIIWEAKRYIGEAQMEVEDYISRLRKLTMSVKEKKDELMKKITELEEEKKRREQEVQESKQKMMEEVQKTLSHLIQEFREEAQSLLKDLEEKKEQMKLDRLRLKKERILKDRLRKTMEAHPKMKEFIPRHERIEIGSHVKVEPLNIEGIVQTIHEDGFVEVLCGKKKFRVKMVDCLLVDEKKKRKGPMTKAADRMSIEIMAKKHISGEINVIGKRSNEALREVDKYLDDAYLAGFRKIKIIHGIGKGKLKNVIQNMLQSHYHVSSFRTAEPGEGGGGATIVELKD